MFWMVFARSFNRTKVGFAVSFQVWSTAKLWLTDRQKEHRENRNKVDRPKFSEAVELFKRELEFDTTIKPQCKKIASGVSANCKISPEIGICGLTKSLRKPARNDRQNS